MPGPLAGRATAPPPPQAGIAPAHARAPRLPAQSKSKPLKRNCATVLHMSVAFHGPRTQQQFFSWAQVQDVGYEFDGTKPVPIAGWTAGHSRVSGNIVVALSTRLGKARHEVLRLAGMETTNQAVRYPDVLVSHSKADNKAHLVADVSIVFEVVGPGSEYVDRIAKVREYAKVLSVRRYVIVESCGIGLTVMERSSPDQVWQTTVLTGEDILRMPEIGVEIPVAEIYDGIDFEDQNESPG